MKKNNLIQTKFRNGRVLFRQRSKEGGTKAKSKQKDNEKNWRAQRERGNKVERDKWLHKKAPGLRCRIYTETIRKKGGETKQNETRVCMKKKGGKRCIARPVIGQRKQKTTKGKRGIWPHQEAKFLKKPVGKESWVHQDELRS